MNGDCILLAPKAVLRYELVGSSADAMALAHLVLSGTHLGYIVWPANAEDPAVEPRVLDERTARSLLGLSVPATPTLAPPVTPAPAPSLVGPPTDRSGFLYQVQPGDSWPSIAATFGMSVLQLEVWNEITPDDDPVPGRLVFIPRAS